MNILICVSKIEHTNAIIQSSSISLLRAQWQILANALPSVQRVHTQLGNATYECDGGEGEGGGCIGSGE